MATMDFAYDLMDKLREQGMDFCLVLCQHGDTHNKVDLFYEAADEQSEKSILYALHASINAIANGATKNESGETELDFGEISPDILNYVVENGVPTLDDLPEKKPTKKSTPKKASKKAPKKAPKKASKKAPKKASKKAPKKPLKKNPKNRKKKDDDKDAT